jgi:hypothetical protein
LPRRPRVAPARRGTARNRPHARDFASAGLTTAYDERLTPLLTGGSAADASKMDLTEAPIGGGASCRSRQDIMSACKSGRDFRITQCS